MHRHLQPLARLKRPVLVVPCGSGNDFARALHLLKPGEALRAWQAWHRGARNVCRVDLGVITPLGADELAHTRLSGSDPTAPSRSTPSRSPAHYFCSVAGCGLDQQAARWANQLPSWLRARGGYVLGLVAALAHFRPVTMRLQTSDASSPPEGIAGRRIAMFVALANAPFYGGGMLIAPRARLEDGKLDICLVNRLGKLRLLLLFPTVYRGRHLNLREVEYFQTDRLILEAERRLPVYADGEYVCRTPMAVSLSPAALPVLVGDGFPRKASGE